MPVTQLTFLHEAQQMGRGVVVNQGDRRGRLELNKREFFEEFVRGELFTLFYPDSVSPAQLVAAPDANFAGYNFWPGKLEEFGGDYINAEMVKAFITSEEYVTRVGR
ncbi:MAG: DUF4214 domain-containing protein [Acidobacteria bacterium]|nr:DUF4214 domain-containing protein [Acidobacteriota bacterium]